MRFFRKGRFLMASLWPGSEDEYDVVGKDTKTYQSFIQRKPSNETGWDRIKRMFQLDEFENISAELNSIHQTGLLGFLIGGAYGGITQSRTAYMNFMENNQATAFKSHLDAKRKLQDQFTVNFAKGAFKWGWRTALFTTSYYGIITMVSVYREKSSIYEYLAAGGFTGALYKVNLGLRGVAAGGIIGCALGAIAGATSLLIMKATGTNMEEIRYWQYKWLENRNEDVREAMKVESERSKPQSPLVVNHENKTENTLTLESVK